MPKVNLSGPVAKDLQHKLAEARHLRAAGDFPAAAEKYRHCAKLQTQLAEYAINGQVKLQQLQVAKTYAETAYRLDGQQDAMPQLTETTESHRQQIRSLIVTSTTTTWENIADLTELKHGIQAAYALALAKRPSGVERKPVDKILLYGPPGTGKTMLAAATSHELDATFFSVKASELLSKWFGESTRLVSALYAEAAAQAPSVIFLEEFDALARARDQNDHGAERRIVSTFLAELDGMDRHTRDVPYVLTIAATNLPWLIDKPILERFGARLFYVPLPDESTRKKILHKHANAKGYELAVPLEELAQRTAGFSGRDLSNLCSLAIERMELEANPEILSLRAKAQLQDFQLSIQPLNAGHFDYALSRITPQTTVEDIARFQHWRQSVQV